MVLILLFLLGLGLGLVRGGNLGNLAAMPIRHVWLPLLAFALQAGFVLYAYEGGSFLASQRSAILLITYAGLIGFLLVNRAMPGTRLLLLGAALNVMVMFANGGHMPVTPEALARSGHLDRVVLQGGQRFVNGSKDIVLEKEDTRLWLLSDVMGIPETLPFSSSFSPGDLLIGLGAAILTCKALTAPAGEPADGSAKGAGGIANKARRGSGRHRGRGSDESSGYGTQDDRSCVDGPSVSGGPAAESIRSNP